MTMTDDERDREGITRADLDALRRAMEIARQDPDTAEQLDAKLRDETWFDVAKFAAYSVQIDSLGLGCHQLPPCAVSLDEPRTEHTAAPQAMLRRMLDRGVSPFEPDPIRAMGAPHRGRRRAL
jgi:hypothetical protein